MSKERFEDTKHDLLKALSHCDIAKKYFEMLMIGKTYDAKEIFKNYILKLDWILKNVFDRLGEQNRVTYKQILLEADNIFLSACAEKLALVPENKKEMIEHILDAVIKGEEIKFIDDNQLIQQ